MKSLVPFLPLLAILAIPEKLPEVVHPRLRLDAFRAEWLKKQSGPEAEYYPSEMPAGEWDEQFRAYDET